MPQLISRRRTAAILCALAAFCLLSEHPSHISAAEEDGKLRIIAFGAHPDDAEFKVGGTAIQWAQQGHHVKLVSVTNGDIGHWAMAGGPLALRRKAEVEKAAEIMGTTIEVLDIHDGELMPTLENRKLITRLIREWDADIVLSHRPNDYHPDHRYVGVLVQDAAYMVAVPFIVPDVKPLDKNPVFLFYSDRFQRPYPFQADIVVSIDDVFEKTLDVVDALESQVYEGGAVGSEEFTNSVPRGKDARREWLIRTRGQRYVGVANQYRDQLISWYGEEKGKQVKYAEAFEICEYGRQPSREEIRELFPFFNGKP